MIPIHYSSDGWSTHIHPVNKIIFHSYLKEPVGNMTPANHPSKYKINKYKHCLLMSGCFADYCIAYIH